MIAGLILAGGRARRLGGGDKPLLRLGGTTMLERIAAAIALPAIAISANGDPARFARFGFPVLSDGDFFDAGPLAGVLAGLEWAERLGAMALLTVPGDTPFIPLGLAAVLTPAPACAASGGRRHHTIALWPVEARIALRAHLSRPGPRDVAGFAAAIGMRAADFASGPRDPFLNVNTSDDLETARNEIGAEGENA